jgi:hypothetical protein
MNNIAAVDRQCQSDRNEMTYAKKTYQLAARNGRFFLWNDFIIERVERNEVSAIGFAKLLGCNFSCSYRWRFRL